MRGLFQLGGDPNDPLLRFDRPLHRRKNVRDLLLLGDWGERHGQLRQLRLRKVRDRRDVASAEVKFCHIEGIPKPIHAKLWMSLLALRTEAMEMVLVQASIDLIVPECCSSNRTALADKQIVRLKFEACLLGLTEMHFIEISQFEAIPEDVLGSEKRALVFAVAVLFRDLLSLLNVESRINAAN
jgi:hypothetical protein